MVWTANLDLHLTEAHNRMDSPGFPQVPTDGLSVGLIWVALALLVLALLILVALGFTRKRKRIVVGLLGIIGTILAAVAWASLWLPASAYVGDSRESGRAECPAEAIYGTQMRNPNGEALSDSDFWTPCRDASRVKVAVTLGGYAAAVVVIGGLIFRFTRKPAA